MSDISKMIEITKSQVELPDCEEYKAELKITFTGFFSKELRHEEMHGLAFAKFVDRLKRQVLDTVYKDVIYQLDVMRRELYVEARTAMFEGYTAKIEMAEKIGKLANELREA